MLDSFAGFDDFLVYLAVSLALLACFVAIYVRVTPHREFALIREGNIAAAFSLSGSLLGFIVPLASAIEYSVSLVDMAIWGAIALVVQVAAFVVVKLLIPTITRRHRRGQAGAGLLPRRALARRGPAQRRLHDLLNVWGRVREPVPRFGDRFTNTSPKSRTVPRRSRTQSRHSANSPGVRAAITERSHAGPAQKSSSRSVAIATPASSAMRAPAA